MHPSFKRIVLASVATFCLVLGVSAGPFGLDMGMSLERLQATCKTVTKVAPGKYRVTPPRPNPSFESYTVRVSPTLGLYQLFCAGKDVKAAPAGTELKTAFNVVRVTLEKAYGVGKFFDYLKKGSTLGLPTDWMKALARKEREFVEFWSAEDMRLPENLQLIVLDAVAQDAATGYVTLEYFFRNADAAGKEKPAEAASPF